tara:strand:+ start:13023 stop:14039 length:1017 start_codon:yes stop_codon:yes gene_type:complete
MKKITLVLLFLATLSAKSQDLDLLLLANDDASLLMKNYMTPVMDGMLYSLNNGWYHTAKTHKKLGFDITINVNAAMVPNSAKTFQFNESDYDFLSIVGGNNKIETVMGGSNSDKISVEIPTEAGDFKIAEFTMPDGIGKDVPLNAVPSPMIQASVGIPFDTDISIRFLPKINTDDVDGNLIGFGIKHNLMQYFGPLDRLPLNIAIFGGFTSMNTTYTIDKTNNQEVAFKLNAFTIQTIASLDFPLVTIYGAIGYDKGTSTLKLKGTYSLSYDIEDTSGNVIKTITENSDPDPINMDFDANGARGTLGLRFNLGFFKLYGDYTIKEYNTVSAGMAFSFR